jgi:hypothetical protein
MFPSFLVRKTYAEPKIIPRVAIAMVLACVPMPHSEGFGRRRATGLKVAFNVDIELKATRVPQLSYIALHVLPYGILATGEMLRFPDIRECQETEGVFRN